jgi:hypothetical protein
LVALETFIRFTSPTPNTVTMLKQKAANHAQLALVATFTTHALQDNVNKLFFFQLSEKELKNIIVNKTCHWKQFINHKFPHLTLKYKVTAVSWHKLSLKV